MDHIITGDQSSPNIWLHGQRQQPWETNIPLPSSSLVWELEAEPEEPGTHFSNLSNSLCLPYHYYVTPKTHNSFLTGLPQPFLCFH